MSYGGDGRPLVSENRYGLGRNIMGIGFKSADLIAERLGISRTAMVRARAGIAYTLAEAMANGHCGLAEDELLVQAEKLLEIPSAILAEALQAELATGEVVADLINTRRCIFLAYLWRAERLIAHRLQTLIHERPPWPVIHAQRPIAWVEKNFRVPLPLMHPTPRAL